MNRKRDFRSVAAEILGRIDFSRGNISLKTIREIDLPNFIKSYFELEVERLYRRERARRYGQTLFDYEDEDVKRLAEEFDPAVKGTFMLSRKRCADIIEEAIVFEVNYWLNPFKAFPAAVYGAEGEIFLQDAICSTAIMSEGRSELDGVCQWLGAEDEKILSKDRFVEIVEGIIRRNCLERPVDSAVEAVSRMGEVMKVINPRGEGKVGVKIIEKMLDVRGLNTCRDVVSRERKAGALAFTGDQFLQLMKAEEVFGPGKGSLPYTSGKLLEELKEYEDFLSELRSEHAETESVVETEPAPPADEPGGPTEEPEVPVSAEDREVQPVEEEVGPPPELPFTISPEDEIYFIRELFRGNRRDYIRFISKLSKASSWDEAELIIDRVMEEEKIDPYSEASMKFIDIAFEGFKKAE